MKQFIKAFFVSAGIMSGIAFSALSYADEQVMYAHYIYAGQADATLLEFPCGTVLIDAGAQDGKQNNDDPAMFDNKVVAYLKKVFADNPQLNNTINTVLITHNHIDHTLALKKIAQSFTIQHYIDNGQLEGRGTENPRWIRQEVEAGRLSAQISAISDNQIIALPAKTGLTNDQIDAINCTGIDPQIHVLSGRIDQDPGWSLENLDNKNNHSLVIRVDFGKASFLFTGDLQQAAIDTLVDYYKDTNLLDVDVYQVGHHGSHNATTVSLLESMTPDIAVISMGFWKFGQDSNSRFTTWAYGHPRQDIVEMLTLAIDRRRSHAVEVAVAEGARQFHSYTVKKAIYGTGWFQKTIRIRATSEGKYRVNLVEP